jgi:chromosome segregation ATPase
VEKINLNDNEEFVKLRNEVETLKYEIQRLKESKVNDCDWQKDMSALEIELIKLSSKLEEVMNDRKEDRALISSIMSDMKQLKDLVHENKMDNGIIKESQKNALAEIVELKKDTKKILEQTSFNWLELIKKFISDNIIAKVLSWSVMLAVASGVVTFAINQIKKLMGW